MAVFRMRIPASVCFSVEADSEEQAIEKIKAFVQDNDEGIPLDVDQDEVEDAGEIDPEAAVYLYEHLEADVIGVEDVEDEGDEDDGEE